MMYFDDEEKQWKKLSSLAPATENAVECYCAETVGGELFVAIDHCIYCYDIETDKWQKHEDPPRKKISSLSTVGDYMYAISSDSIEVTKRFSFPKRKWQSLERASDTFTDYSDFNPNKYYNSGATALCSKVYALYGHEEKDLSGHCQKHNAVLYCFDPESNLWRKKTSTCRPHFGSSLFAVNGRLYVAGGYDDIDNPFANPAPVEVYDEHNNKWSVVEQKRIPINNLGAVEIEGRVYFIINKFPIDSGIRIPAEELYPVYLGDWKNLTNVANNAALCYAPLKRESFKAD